MGRLLKVNNTHLFVQGCSRTVSIFHRLLQADVSQGKYYRQRKYTPTQKKKKTAGILQTFLECTLKEHSIHQATYYSLHLTTTLELFLSCLRSVISH